MDIIENSEIEPKNLTVEELFRVVLHELGFSFKIRGTQYLEEFFMLAYVGYDNPSSINVAELCKIIADRHDIYDKNVYRTICYSITVAWNKGNPRLQNEIFGSHFN